MLPPSAKRPRIETVPDEDSDDDFDAPVVCQPSQFERSLLEKQASQRPPAPVVEMKPPVRIPAQPMRTIVQTTITSQVTTQQQVMRSVKKEPMPPPSSIRQPSQSTRPPQVPYRPQQSTRPPSGPYRSTALQTSQIQNQTKAPPPPPKPAVDQSAFYLGENIMLKNQLGNAKNDLDRANKKYSQTVQTLQRDMINMEAKKNDEINRLRTELTLSKVARTRDDINSPLIEAHAARRVSMNSFVNRNHSIFQHSRRDEMSFAACSSQVQPSDIFLPTPTTSAPHETAVKKTMVDVECEASEKQFVRISDLRQEKDLYECLMAATRLKEMPFLLEGFKSTTTQAPTTKLRDVRRTTEPVKSRCESSTTTSRCGASTSNQRDPTFAM